MRADRWVRMLWAGPWSLLGLIAASLFDRRSVRSGALWCEGARWPRKLGWRYRAITLGHVVLAVDEFDDRTQRHELEHVRQYERWGPLLVPAYVIAAVAAVASGGHYYRDNAFEKAARRAE